MPASALQVHLDRGMETGTTLDVFGDVDVVATSQVCIEVHVASKNSTTKMKKGH